jgi:PsbN protein
MDLDPAFTITISVAVVVVAITAAAIYTSFGPPSKTLSDPFEDHED